MTPLLQDLLHTLIVAVFAVAIFGGFAFCAFHVWKESNEEREQAKRARQDIIKANPVNRLDVRV